MFMEVFINENLGEGVMKKKHLLIGLVMLVCLVAAGVQPRQEQLPMPALRFGIHLIWPTAAPSLISRAAAMMACFTGRPAWSRGTTGVPLRLTASTITS